MKQVFIKNKKTSLIYQQRKMKGESENLRINERKIRERKLQGQRGLEEMKTKKSEGS